MHISKNENTLEKTERERKRERQRNVVTKSNEITIVEIKVMKLSINKTEKKTYYKNQKWNQILSTANREHDIYDENQQTNEAPFEVTLWLLCKPIHTHRSQCNTQRTGFEAFCDMTNIQMLTTKSIEQNQIPYFPFTIIGSVPPPHSKSHIFSTTTNAIC